MAGVAILGLWLTRGAVIEAWYAVFVLAFGSSRAASASS
jgi:hypothetical protein